MLELRGCTGMGAPTAATCANCSAGTYSTASGATAPAACFNCAAGTYSASGSTACATCVAGAYSTGMGLTTCAQCSGGSYQTGLGMTSPALCTPFFALDKRGGDTVLGPDGATQYDFSDVIVSNGATKVQNVTVPRGIQIWTVRVAGTYALSAGGGAGGRWSGPAAAPRVVVATSFRFEAGDTVFVLVGQQGEVHNGGGGSFISKFVGSAKALRTPPIIFCFWQQEAEGGV